jgi:hypothetical protein
MFTRNVAGWSGPVFSIDRPIIYHQVIYRISRWPEVAQVQPGLFKPAKLFASQHHLGSPLTVLGAGDFFDPAAFEETLDRGVESGGASSKAGSSLRTSA